MYYYQSEKLLFLDGIDKEKTPRFKSIFTNVAPYEKNFNKDLYDFTLDEIKEFFKNQKFSYTRAAFQTLANGCSTYVSWAIQNNKTVSKVNPLTSNRDKWINEILRIKRPALHYSDFAFITGYSSYAQDACLLWLLFEGVDGNELDEIINLKKCDVCEKTSTLTLFRNDNGEVKSRKLKVSQKCIDSIKDAINDSYYSFDKEADKPWTLVNSDYIIRPTAERGEKKITYSGLNGRIRSIKGYLDEYSGINRTYIRNSGIYYHAKNLILQHKCLTTDLTKILTKRYGKEYSKAENVLMTELRKTLPLIYPEVSQWLYTKEGLIKKRKTIIEQRIRNKAIVEELKCLYKNKCQICGNSLTLYEGLSYSEVHHIHPIKDFGKDEKENMLVLCPNHHKMFDIGIISLNNKATNVIHIDDNDNLHNQPLKYSNHKLDMDCIQFHHDQYFLPLRTGILFKEKD